jgi:hypothetical protein
VTAPAASVGIKHAERANDELLVSALAGNKPGIAKPDSSTSSQLERTST